MSELKKYTPTNDSVFKILFGRIGSESITKSFIESITKEKIESITLGHKLELDKKHPTDKQMIADVIAKDEQGKKYIIEMQRHTMPGIIERFFSYICKVYVSDIEEKGDYSKLKKTVLVLLLEESISRLKDVQDYHSVIELSIKKYPNIDLKHIIELHVVDLQKYILNKEKTGRAELWLEFLTNPEGRYIMEKVRTDEELAEAVEKLRELYKDKEARAIVEAEEFREAMRRHEEYCIKEEARIQGLKERKRRRFCTRERRRN